jgi:hypothetical protein
MHVEIGAEAALFPEKEYVNGIAVAVQYSTYVLRAILKKRVSYCYKYCIFLFSWEKYDTLLSFSSVAEVSCSSEIKSIHCHSCSLILL